MQTSANRNQTDQYVFVLYQHTDTNTFENIVSADIVGVDWHIHQLAVDQWHAALVWLAIFSSNATVHFWTHMRSGVCPAHLASIAAP